MPQLLRVPVGPSLRPADISPCFYYIEWNSVIQPGQFITASFCASKTGANFTPQVVLTQSN